MSFAPPSDASRSGVTVVTVETPAGQVHGMTASSFCSVSLRPPLVLVCIDHLAETYLHIRERGRFGVSILKGRSGSAFRVFCRSRTQSRCRAPPRHSLQSDEKWNAGLGRYLGQSRLLGRAGPRGRAITPSLSVKSKKLASPKGPRCCISAVDTVPAASARNNSTLVPSAAALRMRQRRLLRYPSEDTVRETCRAPGRNSRVCEAIKPATWSEDASSADSVALSA